MACEEVRMTNDACPPWREGRISGVVIDRVNQAGRGYPRGSTTRDVVIDKGNQTGK
jgi:hypothetical protein